MTKDEAEKGIRYLCGVWGKEVGVVPDPEASPSFGDFLHWMQEKHSAYLNFRSRFPTLDVVEQWFDEEFKQTWRN